MLGNLFAQGGGLLPQFFKGGAIVAALPLRSVVLPLLRWGRCRSGHLRHHPDAMDDARADVDSVHGQP